MSTHKKNFETFLQENLNPLQQQAVLHGEGPLLVVAGAGSGKTRVITARITHLILNKNIAPSSIVALTFTNKAATEMKERIATFLDKKGAMPFVGTFHAYCLQLLKTNPHLLKHPTFSILDEEDQRKIISRLITKSHSGKKITAKQVAYHISKIKNSVLPQKQTLELPANTDPLIRQLYAAYETEKELAKCFDFDDLLIEALKIFQSAKTFKENFHTNIRHILVDEYQDTNITQHELLKHMALDKKKFAIDSLCAVGDEDQSIYSWRGATVANIMNFKKDFPATQLITVDQNYRSVQQVLDAANGIITNNENRNPKSLWSDKKGTDRIRVLSCLSNYQEADAIATYLHSLSRVSSLKSAAILYRAHYQSRTLEEVLIKNSIPYRIIGGIQFYERAEIKDILAYLRLMVNPFDRVSFFRVVNTPSRGLGEKFEEQVYELWNEQPFLTFAQVCKELIDQDKITKVKQEGLTKFLSIFEHHSAADKTSVATEKILKSTSYAEYLRNEHDPEQAQDKIANVKELIQAIQHFEDQGIVTISGFLDTVALMQEKNSDTENKLEHVQLMTLHAAKGLEFDNVIITGLEEGVLPSSRSLFESAALEEERRLLYVGITRTRERLLLTHTRYRNTYGQMEHQIPSRFLDEIPSNLAKVEDCSHWQQRHMQTYFSEWLNLKQQIIAPSIMTFGFSQKEKTAPVKAQSKKSNLTSKTKPGSSTIKKNQPVKHEKFGVGIVEEIEKKSDGSLNVTVRFKAGTKKISSTFLQSI
jgi:DNA helicase-2/ATP-dependent DNA helicase PcrA